MTVMFRKLVVATATAGHISHRPLVRWHPGLSMLVNQQNLMHLGRVDAPLSAHASRVQKSGKGDRKTGMDRWAIMMLASLPALYYLYERLWGDADLHGEDAHVQLSQWMEQLDAEMTEYTDHNRKLIRAELLGEREGEKGENVDVLKEDAERKQRHLRSELSKLDQKMRRTNAHHLIHQSSAGYRVLRAAMLQRDAVIQLHALNILNEMAIVEPYANAICSKSLLGPVFTTLTQSNDITVRHRSAELMDHISQWESTHETLANWIEIYETMVRLNDPLDVEVTSVMLTRILGNNNIDRSKGRLLPLEVLLRTVIDRNERDTRARKMSNIGLLYAQGKREIADKHMTRRMQLDSSNDLIQQLKYLAGIPLGATTAFKLAHIPTLPTVAVSALMLAGTVGINELKIQERRANSSGNKEKASLVHSQNLVIASHISAAAAIGALYYGPAPALAALTILYLFVLGDPLMYRLNRASAVSVSNIRCRSVP